MWVFSEGASSQFKPSDPNEHSSATGFKYYLKGDQKLLNFNKGKGKDDNLYSCNDDSIGCLCTVDNSEKLLYCQENVCPYGMYYDPNGKNPISNESTGWCQDCENRPNNNSVTTNVEENFTTIRGVKVGSGEELLQSKGFNTDNPKKPDKLKFILTDYSFPGSAYITSEPSGDVIKDLIDDMINNFCKDDNPNYKIDIYSLYVHTPISDKNGKDEYKYFNNPTWMKTNFIDKCNNAGIKPGITVYPDDSWKIYVKDGTVWQNIGYYITKILDNKVEYLVYDSEAAPSGSDLDTIRSEFSSQGVDINNMVILSSKGAGYKAKSSNPKNDISLGEVYWNIGQSWPCRGNTSQFNYYTAACKELSSHNAFKKNPYDYLVYLNNSYGAVIGNNTGNNILSSLYKVDPSSSRTMPLFSTESLFSGVNKSPYFQSSAEQAGNSFTTCAAAAYFSDPKNPSTPSMNDKVCGTFDGFSYWSKEGFFKFMLAYNHLYVQSQYTNSDDILYAGIYAPAFIPNTWMKTGKFNNPQYAADLKKWPCSYPINPDGTTDWDNQSFFDKNKLSSDCLMSSIVDCKKDGSPPSNDDTKCQNIVKWNNLDNELYAYCRDNKGDYTCQFHKIKKTN